MKKFSSTLTLIAVGIFISFSVASCGPPDEGLQAVESWLRSW